MEKVSTAVIKKAQKGDAKAFSEIYETYYKLILVRCQFFGLQEAEAEDVTQEIFIHLLHKIKLFRFESQFNSWFFRVALNCMYMYFRNKKIKVKWSVDLGNLSDSQVLKFYSTLYQPEAEIYSKQKLDIVNKEFRKFSKQFRDVIDAGKLRGYATPKASKIIKLSIPAFKSSYHRAKVRLQAKLKEAEIEEHQEFFFKSCRRRVSNG